MSAFHAQKGAASELIVLTSLELDLFAIRVVSDDGGRDLLAVGIGHIKSGRGILKQSLETYWYLSLPSVISAGVSSIISVSQLYWSWITERVLYQFVTSTSVLPILLFLRSRWQCRWSETWSWIRK